jgi:dihydropyrimidinase
VALIYDGLVNRAAGDTTKALMRWVDVCATTPARLLGFGRKGQLLPGYDADVVIFDPRQEWVITPDSLCETAGWSPYDGQALRGRATTTISRGEIIMRDGQWLGAPGRGRFVQR